MEASGLYSLHTPHNFFKCYVLGSREIYRHLESADNEKALIYFVSSTHSLRRVHLFI